MENDNDQRTNSHDDKQLVSETSLGRNSEKKVDAALGNQTETSTVKVSQLQNSRKGKISESSCDAGKRRHDLFFLLLPMRKCWGWLVGRGGEGLWCDRYNTQSWFFLQGLLPYYQWNSSMLTHCNCVLRF